MAQEKSAIEIKRLEKQSFGTINTDANISKKENNQFQIVANENVDVNLKFNLKKEGNVNVRVTDKNDKLVFSKEYYKEGENKLAFTMEENERYTFLIAGNNQSNLIVNVTKD